MNFRTALRKMLLSKLHTGQGNRKAPAAPLTGGRTMMTNLFMLAGYTQYQAQCIAPFGYVVAAGILVLSLIHI